MSDPYSVPSGSPQQPWGAPALPGASWGAPAAQASRVPPHVEPQPYHRILRTRDYHWWRPLVGLAVFVVTFVILTIAATIIGIVIESAATGDSFDLVLDRYTTEVSPWGLLTTNLMLATLIPAAMLALLAGHGLRPGWLASVAARMRWSLLWRMGLLALGVLVLSYAGSLLLPVDEGATEVDSVALSTWLGFAVVVLLTTPLQAAGEEYAFRGYVMQALGAWVRTPWFAAVVTSLAFGFAHGTQSPALFIDRTAFGLVAAFLVIRTGGLEASIAMHVVNNAVVFLVAAAFDQVDDALTVTDTPWSYVAYDVATMVLFAWLALRLARRRKAATVTAYAKAEPPRPW